MSHKCYFAIQAFAALGVFAFAFFRPHFWEHRFRAAGAPFSRFAARKRTAIVSVFLMINDPARRTIHDRVARTLVDRKFTPRYDYAVQMLKELPYGKWREYDPEDTIRFYALRLHEAGLLKSNPQKLIAQASDWRILNELKKELKG